jgi:hypothetical protein
VLTVGVVTLRRVILRYGEAFSVTQRLILPGQDTFVKLEDGSGWLFESKRGVACLRGLPLEYGLFVYRVLRQPNMPLLVRPDVTADPPKVQSHLQVRLPMPLAPIPHATLLYSGPCVQQLVRRDSISSPQRNLCGSVQQRLA